MNVSYRIDSAIAPDRPGRSGTDRADDSTAAERVVSSSVLDLDWLRKLNVLARLVTGCDRRWKRRGPDSESDLRLDSEQPLRTELSRY